MFLEREKFGQLSTEKPEKIQPLPRFDIRAYPDDFQMELLPNSYFVSRGSTAFLVFERQDLAE